jgi:hypothetical protein
VLTCLSAKPWAALLPLRESLALSMSPDMFVVWKSRLVGRGIGLLVLLMMIQKRRRATYRQPHIYLLLELMSRSKSMPLNVILSDGPTLWMLYVASCDGLQEV